jgi:hypothetical protein
LEGCERHRPPPCRRTRAYSAATGSRTVYAGCGTPWRDGSPDFLLRSGLWRERVLYVARNKRSDVTSIWRKMTADGCVRRTRVHSYAFFGCSLSIWYCSIWILSTGLSIFSNGLVVALALPYAPLQPAAAGAPRTGFYFCLCIVAPLFARCLLLPTAFFSPSTCHQFRYAFGLVDLWFDGARARIICMAALLYDMGAGSGMRCIRCAMPLNAFDAISRRGGGQAVLPSGRRRIAQACRRLHAAWCRRPYCIPIFILSELVTAGLVRVWRAAAVCCGGRNHLTFVCCLLCLPAGGMLPRLPALVL